MDREVNIYALLTKREVKMAEFFCCVFMAEQAWSVKDVLHNVQDTCWVFFAEPYNNFGCSILRLCPGSKHGIPLILPSREGNQNNGIRFFLLAWVANADMVYALSFRFESPIKTRYSLHLSISGSQLGHVIQFILPTFKVSHIIKEFCNSFGRGKF